MCMLALFRHPFRPVSLLFAAALQAFASSAAVAPEIVCDPPDFLLRRGESRSVAVDPDAASLRVSLAADFPKKQLAGRGAEAVLTFMDRDSVPVYVAALSFGEDPASAGFDERALRLTVDSVSPSDSRLRLLDNYLTKDANIAGGVNCLVVDVAEGVASFDTGGNKMTEAGSVPFRTPLSGIELTVSTDMNVRRLEVRQSAAPAKTLMTPWTVANLENHFALSSDPVEGFWSFLDRDNDPKWAIPGGFYDLAVVKSETESGGYDIICLGGASVEGRSWQPGMRKGTLAPTIFANHYRLGWIDARFQTDYPECTADLSASNTILTLSFPLHHSTIRLSRRPISAKKR